MLNYVCIEKFSGLVSFVSVLFCVDVMIITVMAIFSSNQKIWWLDSRLSAVIVTAISRHNNAETCFYNHNNTFTLYSVQYLKHN